MAIAKVIILKNHMGEQWASLLIDNISIGQKAVQDIIGTKIAEFQLNDHAIYDKKSLYNNIIGVGLGKTVFKDICEKMYDNRPVIMNINGGYITQDSIDWEVVKIKSFAFTSWRKVNLLTLLKQENGELEEFVEIIEE